MEIKYKTKDLYEASLIYAKRSGDFIGLEEDGRDYLFVFDNESICRDLAKQYYARKVTVDAKNYSDSIRTCKDLIFNRLREQGR